ncbi:ATP-dependent Clp protease adapter ClpS [Nitrosococcus oceani]|uniref:ATP-dependent Clp protease adapter protein ClpS n=2 Tax=Nitrosococcus oceani TaxID=1229 RepID=Q3J8G4_NITOC|nr:ATP-dependent Clp protease adapter ClpS [Nitrosococcus oceani]KFI18681.1 Clp protease ClpS [Nitrosococcus oceani C-27]ABA58882.1 ATP-dependent Clp protease adaptor protein ClpS [Nitrosococcus oceani ATCC 19707]EDZ67563.1 ATP-dependent Clp protease adaptor protein ClpS [Nitrosococcus oceani AFC27]KFI21942.1 Clp protease ClpS [Nitrosococcus oceani]GEM19026.1 ATP-dependent Clp protease adaptor ClpS [Nitrosococcus oceani]
MGKINLDEDNEGGFAVDTAKPKLKRPPLYKVVMLNDDYTPMEFVVKVLQAFFAMDREKATRVMWQVHTEGKGICGVFTYEIAETKASQVNEYSMNHQHPLKCVLERA